MEFSLPITAATNKLLMQVCRSTELMVGSELLSAAAAAINDADGDESFLASLACFPILQLLAFDSCCSANLMAWQFRYVYLAGGI